MEKNMVHISFGLHDPTGTYSKYVGVAMTSVMENTESNITFHLIIDDSVSQRNKDMFIRLVEQYKHNIEFHYVTIDADLKQVSGLKRVTIGTMFRLKLPEIIDRGIDRIIHLDADVIVNMDIKELWEEEFDGKSILAVKDYDTESATKGELSRLGILSKETYFNAGVEVWNLDKVRREYHFFEQAIDFFEKYGKYCRGFTDQHATNAIIRGDSRLLPIKYNRFTIHLRNKNHTLEKCIYHFAGERPRMEQNERFDVLFFQLLKKTPWGDANGIEDFYKQGIMARNELILRTREASVNSSGRKIIFWGGGSKYISQVINCFHTDPCRDYCIDSNINLVGGRVNGIGIKFTDELYKEDTKGIYVVVVSKLHFDEIAKILLEMGMVYKHDFINGFELLTEDEGNIVYVR